MALEETLRLKVELDQAELGSEIANVRSNIAAAATPVDAPQTVIEGSHPSNSNSIFWGLGAAAQQMGGDFSQATQFVGGVASSGLQAGSVVAQSFSQSTGQVPLYQSPLSNVPIDVGFGAALGHGFKSSLGIDSTLSPFLSRRQSDAISSDYFSNLFKGPGAAELGGDMLAGLLGGAAWSIPGIGWAVAPVVGMLVEHTLGKGADRLSDIRSLGRLGYSRDEATSALGGGYWSAAGNSLNPFYSPPDYLAGVWEEGISIDGREMKGTAAAAFLLDTGKLNVSGAGLQAGMLAMNELVTRTGMGMESAASIVNSSAPMGTFGDESNSRLLATIGMLGPGGTAAGMNTRRQNALMPSLIEASNEGAASYGRSYGLGRAQGTSLIADTFLDSNMFDSQMKGELGGMRERIASFSSTMQTAANSTLGGGSMQLAALAATAAGATDLSSFLSTAELKTDNARNYANTVTGGGAVSRQTYNINLEKIRRSPELMAQSILSTEYAKGKEGMSRHEQVMVLSEYFGIVDGPGLQSLNDALIAKENMNRSPYDYKVGEKEERDSKIVNATKIDFINGDYRQMGLLSLPRTRKEYYKTKDGDLLDPSLAGTLDERARNILAGEGYLNSEDKLIETANGMGPSWRLSPLESYQRYSALEDSPLTKDFISRLEAGDSLSDILGKADTPEGKQKAMENARKLGAAMQTSLDENPGTDETVKNSLRGLIQITNSISSGDVSAAGRESSIKTGVSGASDKPALMKQIADNSRALSEAAYSLANMYETENSGGNVE